MDNKKEDGASASSPPVAGDKDDANVASNVAYMEEPMAPVNSDNEPTAPSRAPDSPGGAKFASSACNAGIATTTSSTKERTPNLESQQEQEEWGED
eukprot:jgi/Psemu1/304265/fgenesh1_kg.143_\